MHVLRTSTLIARLVLAWFVLALGVAAAAPAVQPKAVELVCTAGGSVKVLVIDEDGQGSMQDQHTLDCSLCLHTLASAGRAIAPLPSQQPLAHACTPMAAAHIAALVGAPLPPRGPPQQG